MTSQIAPASGSPPAGLGGWDIVMRLEVEALPEAVASQAEQNEPTDDDQGMQHGGSSALDDTGFKWRLSVREIKA